jgi:predicted site-specific integrase-resolvase
MDESKRFIPTHRARSILGVCDATLREWAKRGKINSVRTSGGHRLYDVNSLIQQQDAQKIDDRPRRKRLPEEGVSGIIYARVSSRHQKDDLKRQVAYLQQQFPKHKIITDIASGVNFKRKGLSLLVEQCMRGGVPEVVVAHRDRIARFGVDLIQHVLSVAGTKLTVLQSDSHAEPQQQLAEDLMSIIPVFACKRNGRRRYGTASKSASPGDKTSPDRARQ